MGNAKVGVQEAPDVGSIEPPNVDPGKAGVKLLTLQRNWKQEITIEGKIVAVFMPGESKTVDAWIPAHRDFEAYKDYFVVQEVE